MVEVSFCKLREYIFCFNPILAECSWAKSMTHAQLL